VAVSIGAGSETEQHSTSPLGRRADLSVNALGVFAALVSLAAALATAVRHESAASAVAFAIGGVGILGSVAFNLARPPEGRAERRLYLLVTLLFFIAVLISIVWLVFA
jgi:hypothetical protein